jgi:hypothetical protein
MYLAPIFFLQPDIQTCHIRVKQRPSYPGVTNLLFNICVEIKQTSGKNINEKSERFWFEVPNKTRQPNFI